LTFIQKKTNIIDILDWSYTWLNTNINLLYLGTYSLVKKGKREKKNIYIIILGINK